MKKGEITIKSVVLIGLFLSAACYATNYYVSGTGSDGQNGLDSLHAFRNLSKAAGLVNPGDTVWMLTGIYSAFTITRSGNESQWIVWKKSPGTEPELRFNSWCGVQIKSYYHIIDGLRVTGNCASITLDSAEADYARTDASGTYNGTGIQVDGRSLSPVPHHIIIRNCFVSDCSESGIYTIAADYITIEGNMVYNNSLYSRYAGSGIGRGYSSNYDQNPGYHNFIRNNILWHNRALVKCKASNSYSDGNGIIIDSDDDDRWGPYTAKTLICNNICFNNGGSGIHSFYSSNVDIINNTTYFNGRRVNYANCYAWSSTNVNIKNNISYAGSNQAGNISYYNTNVVYDYNIYYGGQTPVVMGSHDRIVDPGLLNPSLDIDVANFHLLPESPARNNGVAILGVDDDIEGNQRPQEGTYDIGSYEYNPATAIRKDRVRMERSDEGLLNVSTYAIRYAVNTTTRIDINLYDIYGRQCLKLVNTHSAAPGIYETAWTPEKLANGMYICRMITGKSCSARKICLIK